MTGNQLIYPISRDGKPIATVGSPDDVEAIGESLVPGFYDIDVIHAGPIEGLTSWHWGTLTKHAHGVNSIDSYDFIV